LADTEATALLALRPGARVRVSTRPASHVVSPSLALGVHCPVPSRTGARRDGLGTVLSRASLTGGRLAQASTHTLVTLGGAPAVDRRRPWAYHLARPGRVEVGGRLQAADLVDGFLAAGPGDAPSTTLDLGTVCGRLLDRVQESLLLDQKLPIRAPRTRFRFALLPCEHAAAGDLGDVGDHSVVPLNRAESGRSDGAAHVCRVSFLVAEEMVRTLRISGSVRDLVSVVGLCEDLALHDWLLTTVQRVVVGSRVRGAGGGRLPSQLRPVIDHLLHLWMPGARVVDALLPVWAGVEQRSGISRQWESLVGWIRDQLALSLLASMGDGAG
jgi:hypothetical protein